MRRRAFLLLMVLLGAALALALAVGAYPLHLADVTHTVLRAFGFEAGLPTPGEIAFGRVRLPRVVAGLVVGAALSGAGATYQTLFRNPLVSPDILGVAAGAGLGAGVGILLSLPVVGIQALAFAGGLATVAVVYLIAAALRGHDRTRWCWCSAASWRVRSRAPASRWSRSWPIRTTSSPPSRSGCSAASRA
jgi:iron complex transport system permease protein